MDFYEKVDDELLNKCKEFIERNWKHENNHQVYREALSLCIELIENLLLSQKEFNDAIKTELAQYPVSQVGPEIDAFTYKFNNKEFTLFLDFEAHKVLEQLEEIERRNHSPFVK